MPASFFDTNVLLYTISDDVLKADRADHILAEGGAISIQVLNEIANVARRKMQISWAETRTLLETFGGLLAVHSITISVHHTGLRLGEHYGLSIYDAMIVASALHAECDILWSEDMQHGMVIEDRLRIVNPFHATP